MAHFLDPKHDLTFKYVFAQNRAEKKLHELWLRFLTEINENTKEIPQELLEHELLREAVGYMEKSAYTKEQLAQYDKWKIDLMSAESMIDDAKIEGRVEGREEGEAIGLEKGRAEGEAEREQLKAEKEAAQAKLKEKTENEAALLARIAKLEKIK